MCIFAKRRRLFTTPKGRVNGQKQYTLWVGVFLKWGIATELNQIAKIDISDINDISDISDSVSFSEKYGLY